MIIDRLHVLRVNTPVKADVIFPVPVPILLSFSDYFSTYLPRGSGTSATLEGQERYSAKFFPCNATVLTLNFAKFGEEAAPFAPSVAEPLYLPQIDARSTLIFLIGSSYTGQRNQNREIIVRVVSPSHSSPTVTAV